MPIPYYTRAEIDMMFGKDPSEVRIIFYTDAAPKPVTGAENVLYVDRTNLKAEVWNPTTSVYDIITGDNTPLTYEEVIEALGFTPADVNHFHDDRYYTKAELDTIHGTFLTEETDPVFVASPAYGITPTNITNWSEAFSKMVSAISVTGDANKILTITFQDSSTLTASFTDMAGVADGDEYVNSLNFNTTDGVLTVGRTGELTDITVSLDGRYLTSLPAHTHAWSEITGKPTIVNTVTGTAVDNTDPLNPIINLSNAGRFGVTGEDASIGTTDRSFALGNNMFQFLNTGGNGKMEYRTNNASYLSIAGFSAVQHQLFVEDKASGDFGVVKASNTQASINHYRGSDFSNRSIIVDDWGIYFENGNNGFIRIPQGKTGYLVTSVNGIDADTTGNVVVPTGGITEETDPIFVASEAYSITTANKTNWTTAYNKHVTAVSVTGDENKILTLTFQDSTTLTASFTDVQGGVADGDEYVNSLNFDSANGVLTVGRTGTLTDITVSLDGRYLTSLPAHTHTWEEITGKPATFAPSFHEHLKAHITDFIETDYIHRTGDETKGGNLTLSNDFKVVGISNQAGIYDLQASTIRVLNPKGGIGSIAIHTGAIKIQLPHLWTTSSIKFTFEIYDDSGKTCTIKLGGVNDSSTLAWRDTFAYITGADIAADVSVRYGHDGTKACVWIGELNDSWYGCRAVVSDVTVGGDNITSSWASGWNVASVLTFGTVQSTHNNNFVWGDWNRLKNVPSGGFTPSSHTHSWTEITGKPTFDNYVSWNLKTNGVQRTTVQSGGVLDIVGTGAAGVTYGAGGVVTINVPVVTPTDISKTVQVDNVQSFTATEQKQGRANILAEKRSEVRIPVADPTNQNFIDWESDILLVKTARTFTLPATGVLVNGSRFMVKTTSTGSVQFVAADGTVSIEYNDVNSTGYMTQRSEAWVLFQDNVYYVSGEVV